jgi:hypothetical protein
VPIVVENLPRRSIPFLPGSGGSQVRLDAAGVALFLGALPASEAELQEEQ